MKIAVTYADGMIFQHFGHTQQFKIYEVENGAVVSSKVVDTNGSGHGALAGLLKDLDVNVLVCGGIGGGAQMALAGLLSSMQVNVLICGGIGGGAQMALAEAGIALYGGCSGDADAAVTDLLAGNLRFNPNVRCDHHDHHGEGHNCGEHHCGGNCH